MKYSVFGSLGWKVSRISIGTVELGLPYGFAYDGETPIPDRVESKRLLLEAFDSGINLVDTSPTYGSAEEILGEALREWHGQDILIAGKIPTWGNRIRETVEASLRRLGREPLDLLQIYSHTADPDLVMRVLDIAHGFIDTGKARALGISIYDESVGLLAAGCDDLKAIQLPYSLLDRRMETKVIPQALSGGKALWGRSALLKGILTRRRSQASECLAELVREAERLSVEAERRGMPISRTALAFCLAQPRIHSVLLGLRNRRELEEAVEALESESDPDWLNDYAFPGDPSLLDPRTWG